MNNETKKNIYPLAVILVISILFITYISSCAETADVTIEDVMTETEETEINETTIEEIAKKDMSTVVADTENSTAIAETETETANETSGAIYFTEQDVIDIAKVMYKECGGVSSTTEKACVAWVILNRADNWGSSVYEIVRQANQFNFSESTTIRSDLYLLAYDVLERWNNEKNGMSESESGRVLPKEYMYFSGDGIHNYFRATYTSNSVWDYSLSSPYSS